MQKTTRRRTVAAVQSPLETYLREINETALLTANEEKELAYGIEQGDKESRDRMVRANLRLVVNIARGYTGKGLPLQDLIEEGNLGLLRAVEGFDPAMGTRFSTYASYWIKQSIKRALGEHGQDRFVFPRTWWSCFPNGGGRPPSCTTRWAALRPSRKSPPSWACPRRSWRIVKKAIQLYNSAPQTDQSENRLDHWAK